MTRAGRTAPSAVNPFTVRRRYGWGALTALLVAVSAVSLGVGAVTVSPGDVFRILLRHIGIDLGGEPSFQADAVVWNIRMPRVLLGIVVGGALAATGAVLQGVFRNRLADPQLLGIGPGAAIGAVIGSIAGAVQGAIGAGIAAGVMTGLLVRQLGDTQRVEPTRFVLVGVALGAALSAWVGFVVFSADSTKVPPIEFWLLGSLTGSTWRALGTTAAVVAIGLLAMLGAARSLDLMALGEAEARHLGVDVGLVTTMMLMAVGAVVGAAVGAVGVVGFVGLLTPHLILRLTGPSHRHLIIGSVIGGAIFVVGADLLARIAASPIEIPVGLVTAAVGGPFFLWLIHRSARV